MTDARPKLFISLNQPCSLFGLPRAGLAERLELALLDGGEFLMGASDTLGAHYGDGDNLPAHTVNLRPFYLGCTAVTQDQWRLVAEWEPLPSEKPWQRALPPQPMKNFVGNNLPVINVSWLDAMEFCARLSVRTGLRFTLPSEAQWEYACRAGTTTPYYSGNTISAKLANYNGATISIYSDQEVEEVFFGTLAAVRSFPPNQWGLYEMHGNVWEWCLDHPHFGYRGAPVDGSAWVAASASRHPSRVLRGGSWVDSPDAARSDIRSCNPERNSNLYTGFRVCVIPDPE